MYSYKSKINYYQDNRKFLSQSYSTKNYFLKQYNKLYNDKEKSKQLYLQILCELKVALCEGNEQNFKKISDILNYIVDTENADELFNCFDEDIYPFKNSNLIILACEHNQLVILKYIFSRYSSLYEHVLRNNKKNISPNDEDENSHNAFYYSIRIGNTELLETLTNKWPGNYFKNHAIELDEILSKAYEELKLKNVLLSESMRFFVEEKLINLRFYEDPSNKSQNNNISLSNINERIELVIEQIDSLKSIDDVSEEFLLILKYVAINIFTLKRQLRSSYDTLPWEEIEFTLVCFISCNTKNKEINTLYREILDKAKIKKHLFNFARRLTAVWDTIKISYKINLLLALPKLSRERVVVQIIKKYPEFEELYQDYHKIRDIHTLDLINNYVTLVSTANVNNKEGRLLIIRSLQVIGECLKNTLVSPKLSSGTSDLLFLSMQKSTRKLATNLRDSLSHAHSLTKRTEILQNEQGAFFEGIKNDIKKIGFILKDIFDANKLRTLKSIYERILSCKSIDELKQIVSLGNSYNQVSFDTLFFSKENYLSEHERFNRIVKKLKDTVPDQTPGEKRILHKMEEVISLQSSQRSDASGDYFKLANGLSCIKLEIDTFFMDDNYLKLLKNRCKAILANLNSSLVQPKDLQSLRELSFELLECCYFKPTSNKKDEVLVSIIEISCIIDIQLGNIHWVSKLRDKLTEQSCYNDQSDTMKTSTNTKEESKSQLKLKLLQLKKILTEYNSRNPSVNNVYQNNEEKILVALDMSVLEILSILDNAFHRLEDNFLFLDENTPLLIGKNLRNHLAHNNAIVDIIPSDPSVALMVMARKFVEELDKNEKRISKSVLEDLEKVKNKIVLQRRIISIKEKMFNALESGCLESLKNCMAQGADIRARKMNMWTSLHAAAKGRNLDVVKFLIEQKVDVKVASIDGRTPLHVAAEFGSVRVVEFFLHQKYYNVDCKDRSFKTPLHLAALNNHKVTVETLLKNNASHSVKDVSGYSPVHYAIQKNYKDVAQVLLKLEKTVDSNQIQGGLTALHLASERGYLELVNFLIDRGASVHARADGHSIPLHMAVLQGHIEVVNLLVKRKSNVNARIRSGGTPLHYAILDDENEAIVNILLSHGADPNLTDKVLNETPLHAAARQGYVGIVQVLIDHKANINVSNVYHKTPLFYAILKGHLNIVEMICQRENAIKNVPFALHLATQSGHVKIVEYFLIDLKMNVNSEDDDGNTPLHFAAAVGKTDIVAILLKNKSKINIKNNQGLTPLLCAVNLNVNFIDDMNPLDGRCHSNAEEAEHIKVIPPATTNEERSKVVEILLDNGDDINAVTVPGNLSVLHLAATTDNRSMVELLIRRGVSVNVKDELDESPLARAAAKGCTEIVKFLIENGANVNFVNKNGYTALHFACHNGSCDLVNLLLSSNANINAAVSRNVTALSLAVEMNHTDVVEILMAHKSQLVSVSQFDFTRALWNNNNDILKLLLRYNTVALRTLESSDFDLSSLLHTAVGKCNEDIILTLLKNGADVNSKNKANVTILVLAVHSEREKVVEILLRNGADVNWQSSDGETVLHVATTTGNREIIEILLKHGANVNAKDCQNRTPVEMAVAYENLSALKTLLSCTEMNINNKGNNGFTLLHIATTRNSDLEVIKYLVTNGADINSRNQFGYKPIHIAAEEGKEEAVKYFLSLGLEIDELAAFSGATPLHLCAMSSKVKLARYLIEQGANVNAKTYDNSTPLHFAVKNRAELEFLKYLLKHGAIYDAVDMFGLKPFSMSRDSVTSDFLSSIDKLFRAVEQNNLVEVKKCIDAGAFVNARNVDNVTPLHLAAWKGFDDIVAELVRNTDIVNVVEKKELTPLHYAAKFGHLNICKSLLAAGAVYDIKDESGKTPLDLSENKEVISLLRLIRSCFEMASTKKVKLIITLKKIKDVIVMKAIMNVRNVDRKSLIAAAILNDFPKVNELKQTMQNDIPSQMREAEIMSVHERYDEAIRIYESILKKRTELFSKNNPATLEIQEMIVEMLYHQHNYAVALEMYRDIYEKKKDQLGENSEETLKTRSSIGLVLHSQGKNAEALAILQQVYEKRTKIHNYQILSDVRLYMGAVLGALGKYDEALEVYTKLFEDLKNSFGYKHPRTLSVQTNIASILASQRKFDQAEKMHCKIYELQKKILGPTHLDTLRTFHNIILVLSKQQKFDEAMKGYEEVLKIQKSCLGCDHLDFLITHLNMGMLLFRQGKYVSAINIFSTSLPKLKSKVGPSNGDVILYERAMETIKEKFKCFGESDIINIINNLIVEARAAVRSGELRALQQLLEDGVDVNEADEDGRTLLHLAANNGNIDIARVLLNSAAILTMATKKGNTPLHIAALKGHVEIVEEFLKHLPREDILRFVNAKTIASGTTALHVAAKAGYYEIVHMLLRYGAVYDLKDNEGKTPQSLSQDQRVVHLLSLIDSCFKDVMEGNAEVISKISGMERDDFLSATNARSDRSLTLVQISTYTNKEIAKQLIIEISRKDLESLKL